MPERFYGAYNNYSIRKVQEEEGPKALEYARNDGVDAVIPGAGLTGLPSDRESDCPIS